MQNGCDLRLPGYLQLIEAQREMQNLCELPRQRLLLLQMLSWAAARAGEELQQALQSVFYTRHKRNRSAKAFFWIEVLIILGCVLYILTKTSREKDVWQRNTAVCLTERC